LATQPINIALNFHSVSLLCFALFLLAVDPPTASSAEWDFVIGRSSQNGEIVNETEHGRSAQGMQQLSPELVAKVRAAIHDEPAGQATKKK
jgi:hypothetical protein